MQCAHSASYTIDGQHLCKKHAQAKALEVLLAIEAKEP
jgi:hypothetical protein